MRRQAIIGITIATSTLVQAGPVNAGISGATSQGTISISLAIPPPAARLVTAVRPYRDPAKGTGHCIDLDVLGLKPDGLIIMARETGSLGVVGRGTAGRPGEKVVGVCGTTPLPLSATRLSDRDDKRDTSNPTLILIGRE